MSLSLYWLQSGGCGGDTMSFLNTDAPDLVELLHQLEVDLLWHPSLSTLTPGQRKAQDERLRNGEAAVDILVVEGAVVRGPTSTGMYDTLYGRPKKDFRLFRLKRTRGGDAGVDMCHPISAGVVSCRAMIFNLKNSMSENP